MATRPAGSRTRRPAPPTPRPPRTTWQQHRDAALRDAGYSKADVHREVLRLMPKGERAPTASSVQAALDGRFRNELVERAFMSLVTGKDPGQTRRTIPAVAEYFPDDEPPYRGPERTTPRRAR